MWKQPSANFTPTAAQFSINRWLWFSLAALALVDWALFNAAGLQSEFTSLANRTIVSLQLIGLCFAAGFAKMWLGRRVLPAKHMLLSLSVILQLLVIGITTDYFSCLPAHLDFPLRDALLLRIDQLLGFDTPAYLSWVGARPYIYQLYEPVYNSLMPQFAGISCLLLVTGHSAHAQRFAVAFLVSVIACCVISAFIPSMGR